MGIMSVLGEMHASPDFKLNLKFEIEVLCRQLQIQLTVRTFYYRKKIFSLTFLFFFFFSGSSNSSYLSK